MAGIIHWLTVNRPTGRSQSTVVLNKSQIFGISMMIHTLGHHAYQLVQLTSSSRNRLVDFREIVQVSHRIVSWVTREDHGGLYQSLANFDPHHANLATVFESHGLGLPMINTRYFALFVGPDDAYVVRFGNRHYLQGAMSVANWLGHNYRSIIRVVYDQGRPMEIV